MRPSPPASLLPPCTSPCSPAPPSPSSTLEALSLNMRPHRLMSNVDEIRQLEVLAAVGEGPMSFGPVCRSSSIQEELMKCNVNVMEKYIKLRLACENEGLDQHFSNEQIFRVATYKGFSVGKSLRLLKRMDPRYMNTTARQLEDQLRTQTLFPLPCLTSDTIDNFFYMRPARYDPNETPTATVIANLIYVMDTLFERHRDYKHHKIGFIANMNDWTMAHFSVDYCFAFMMALQGRSAPLNVDLFLIVNPPSWFSNVWKIMKPMLSPAFRKKVHMIPETKLCEFLQSGFEQHLPDEFQCGQADVPALVEDFITFRKHIEQSSLERADNAMKIALPSWATGKDSTENNSHVRRRRIRSRVPLSKSRKGTEKTINNGHCESSFIPITSWSRMKNPWEDENTDTDGSERSLSLLEGDFVNI